MSTKKKLTSVIRRNHSDLELYKALQLKLAATIDESTSGRDIAALSRQLREVTEKITELNAIENEEDPIRELLEKRAEAGKPGAIRNDRRKAV